MERARMLEGSRAFDLVWGAVTGSLCLALGTFAIVAWMRARRLGTPSFFGSAIDPGRRLHFAYGVFALAMAGTNVSCRTIEHRYLAHVHAGYFALTLLTVAIVAPALIRLRVQTPQPSGAR